MNPVTTALTLNMQLPNIATVSWAVQGDQLSREITATLVDGAIAWNPQVGDHGVVRFHKPDGTSGVYDVDEDGNPAVTWSGNVATVKIVQQALTVPGTVLMQLEFYDAGDARVSAFGWANNVQPSAVTDDEFLSSDYYNILSLQIAGVLGAAGHSPYIDSTTNHWMIWDSNLNAYVDSGVYATGPAPTLESTTYEYANDASGTTPPASGWSGTRPAPVQGQYSWTKTTLTFDSGATVYYTVAYQGIDGAGADFVKALIAQEETSTTSAHAYAIGDYFILANTLYVARDAIGIGDTISAGTNCSQTTVGAELVGIKNTLTKLEDGLAIIVDGDTCSMAVPAGGYAYIKNNTHGLADGLYTNTSSSAFPVSGGTADSTVFTADSGGGLNSLKNSLNPTIISITKATEWTLNYTKAWRIGKLIIVNIYVQGTPTEGKSIATGLPLPTSTQTMTSGGSSPSLITVRSTTGELYITSAGTGIFIGATLVYETSS
jgi:hypothetical protein